MKQLVTKAIVLARTNFGEADKIITVLTKDHGKLRLMAKGVRKVKSKLAGGIELFSVSSISYIVGKGDIYTLTSSRLDTHYGNIIKDIDTTKFGYEILRLINKSTEDATEQAYFGLTKTALSALNDGVDLPLIELWLNMQLLKLGGHTPNLSSTSTGVKLEEIGKYGFDVGDMAFTGQSAGQYGSSHIKLLRLALRTTSPQKLNLVNCPQKVINICSELAKQMHRQFTTYRN